MASKITLKNLQDQEFSINHKDGVGAISIDSDKVVVKNVNGDIITNSTSTTAQNYYIQQSGSTLARLITYPESHSTRPSQVFLDANGAGNNLILSTQNIERLRIDTTGNIGIGTTPNAWDSSFKALQINNNALFGTNANYFNVTSNAYHDGSWKYKNSGSTATNYQQSGGGHYWLTAPSGTAGSTITWTNAMALGGGTLNIYSNIPDGASMFQATNQFDNGYTTIAATGTGTYWGSAHDQVLEFVPASGGNGAISAYSGSLKFFTSGRNERMRIDASGNVGIGTSNAIGKLTIKQSDEFRGINIVSAYNTNEWGITCDGSNSLRFSYNGNGLNSGEKIRIDSAGNVGIGTPLAPWNSAYKVLQLSGGSYITFSNMYGQITANSYLNTSGADAYISNGLATMYAQGGGVHSWKTASSGTAGNPITWTSAMTLDASGILTTTCSSGDYAIKVHSTSTGGTSNGIWHNGYSTASTNWMHFYGTSSNNTLANIIIYGNGNIINANNSYGVLSDIKLKENVLDTSPKLEKLMKVRVVNYNLIGSEQKQIGVIAQEIEQIFPGVVEETKDTIQVEVEKEREKTLEDGTVEIEKYTEIEARETGEVTKHVKSSVIYMMMLKGMQEQQEIIESLKQRIEILEGGK